MIFSPLMRLSGHNRNQETKWCSVSHLLISHPASLMMVVAVMTSTQSICVRSVPVIRNNRSRKSNCGLFPFFFLSRSFRFSFGRGVAWLRSSLCSRYWLSCRSHSAFDAGKTRNHPVPVSVQTADLVASCPPDCAQSAPHWPSLEDPERLPAYADHVGLPEWP